MKILAFSDSHGRIGDMQIITEKLLPHISAVIHLGDNIRDVLRLQQLFADAKAFSGLPAAFFCVPGNCDGYYEEVSKLITLNGRKIFITHGHEHGVKSSLNKLKQAAAKLNADACFYGHTHVANVEYHNNMLVLNPGSIAEPRGRLGASYAVVDVPTNGNMLEGNVVEYNRR